MTTKHVNLRLSPEMHNALVDVAERNHRSMNGQIEEYIERGLAAEPPQLDEGAEALRQLLRDHLPMRGDELLAHLEADHDIAFRAATLEAEPDRPVWIHRKLHVHIGRQEDQS